jgi:L-rhamnose mutarotase
MTKYSLIFIQAFDHSLIIYMHRLGFKMKLHAGQAEEYKRRHDELWPELGQLLKDSTVSDYSIFLDEETNILFGTLKVEDLEKFNQIPQNPITKRWWEYMADVMDTNPDNSPVGVDLKDVFYLA